MPGLILEVDGTKVTGCAWHPRFSTYEVLVHVVVGPAIVRSLFANERLRHADLPEEGIGHGFSLDVDAFGVAAGSIDRARLLIGETDEWLFLSEPEERDDDEITIEEIIGAPFPRPWVSGKIYFDAQAAGLSAETIVDMLYRDYLGRPADLEGLANYSGRIKDGSLTYEAFRRILVGAQEYTQRHWQAHEAPGAIFSQRIVGCAGREYEPENEGKKPKEVTVSLRRLCALDGIEFIVEAARQLSGKLPESGTAWRLLAELRRGRQKLDVIRELFFQPAVLARNVRFADLVEELPTPAGHGRKERPRLVAGTARGRTREGAPVLVPLIELLQLDGTKFVSEAYRRILGRAPGAGEAALCAKELAAGGKKREIILYLAGEPEAIARNVRVVESPDLAYRRGTAAAVAPAAIAHRAAAPPAAAAPEDVVEFGEPNGAPEPVTEPLLFSRAAPAEEAEGEAEAGAGEAEAEDAEAAAAMVGGEDKDAGLAEFDDFGGGVEPLYTGGPAGAATASGEELDVDEGDAYRPFGNPNAREGPLVGGGFHPREDSGGSWWRWTGPGRHAQIRLPVARPGQYRVSIWCDKAPPAVLAGLTVHCCGEAAPVLVDARNGAASLVCDAWAPEAGFTGWIDLELEHGPPIPAPDGRLLGLCIGSIRVEE